MREFKYRRATNRYQKTHLWHTDLIWPRLELERSTTGPIPTYLSLHYDRRQRMPFSYLLYITVCTSRTSLLRYNLAVPEVLFDLLLLVRSHISRQGFGLFRGFHVPAFREEVDLLLLRGYGRTLEGREIEGPMVLWVSG